ncbi:hypothetical protein ACFLZZ_02100 [Nanoarchaeota archaeon]
MLEKIINSLKTKIVLGTSLALLPFANSFAYMNEVKVNGQDYVVEVSESNKTIQVDCPNLEIGKKAAMYSFIEHERILLRNRIDNLEYNSIRLINEARTQSRVLSKKLNKVSKWAQIEDFKVHPWTFLFHGMPIKIHAYKEAIKVRQNAISYLNLLKEDPQKSPLRIYSELLFYKRSVNHVNSYLINVMGSTELDLPFSLRELTNLEKEIEKDKKSLNLKRIEKNKEMVIERITEKLKNSKAGKNYSSKDLKTARMQLSDPFEKISRYKLLTKAPETVFEKSFDIPIYNLHSQELESKGLEIKVRKSCIKGDSYNLRLELLLKNLQEPKELSDLFLLDNLKTNIFLVYPSGVETRGIDQSAYFISFNKGKPTRNLIEIMSSRKDKLKLDASQEVFDKSLEPFRGNITRIRNILDYFSEKIISTEKSNEEIKKDLLIGGLDNYLEEEIEISPTGKQSSSRLISINLENLNNKPVYIAASIGIRDWYDKKRGRIEDLIIDVPNDEVQPKKSNELVWIIPSEWVNPSEDTLEILVPRIHGRKTIENGNNHAEYTIIKVGNQNYSFIDQEFFYKYSLNGKFPAYPITLSEGLLVLELKEKLKRSKEVIPGFYFGNQEEIKSAIIKKQSVMQERLKSSTKPE